MDCSGRMAALRPLVPQKNAAVSQARLRSRPAAGFVDQSHIGFYSKLGGRSNRVSSINRCSGTGFEMATADDESVQDVIRQLEELQMKVQAKKRELKEKKKEMKAKMKPEKKTKGKMCSESSSSSSSSESSDSSGDECGGSVMVMRKPRRAREQQLMMIGSVALPASCENSNVIDTVVTSSKACGAQLSTGFNFTKTCGRIEVCTGGKCKKNGSLEVLAAFQEGIQSSSGGVVAAAASSCKCMKKCGDGPNVRVQVQGDSPQLVYNGVRVEDVNPLLEQLFQVGMAFP